VPRAAPAPGAELPGWLGLSILFHAAVLASVFTLTSRPPVAGPRIYKVDIVAAPPGRRAEGVVLPTPPAPQPKVTTPEAPAPPPPPRPEIAPTAKTVPLKPKVPPLVTPHKPVQSTPVPQTKHPAAPAPAAAAKTPPPTAGGGPEGGKGADVANVHIAGVDFPYPAYLNNIVRQVSLNFAPDDPNSQLRAEVFFHIHRDGRVTDFRIISRSGDYGFDLEAQGAIEKAGPNFGPLPDGFSEDALPVVFSFDPTLIH
jgi:periplasmic protein TonB